MVLTDNSEQEEGSKSNRSREESRKSVVLQKFQNTTRQNMLVKSVSSNKEDNLASLRTCIEKKQKTKLDKNLIFNHVCEMPFYEQLKKHLAIDDEKVMKKILYSAHIQTFTNKYVFRENEKLDKKYYVIL